MQCHPTAQGSPAVWRMPYRCRRNRLKDLCSTGGSDTAAEGLAVVPVRRAESSVSALSLDALGCVFLFLPQVSLAQCHGVHRKWRLCIESHVLLNLSAKTQMLENQCYDECYNFASIDTFGEDVNFCFHERPAAAVHAPGGWVEVAGRHSPKSLSPLVALRPRPVAELLPHRRKDAGKASVQPVPPKPSGVPAKKLPRPHGSKGKGHQLLAASGSSSSSSASSSAAAAAEPSSSSSAVPVALQSPPAAPGVLSLSAHAPSLPLIPPSRSFTTSQPASTAVASAPSAASASSSSWELTHTFAPSSQCQQALGPGGS
eukprot:TRINITY_DN3573_c0_g1_i2.p1 TRINITY_DN3573_c0_g1~~TRINITY_DN3573_c0_g1_i2.p1  ORF type:complete len:340 (+),score=62.53 TRINITY_DN3573_c0_g1_i2:77-1021(+)